MILSADKAVELSPARVLLRFGLRMAILVLFATFGTIGFGRSLAALLWMTVILCAVLATMRRERVFAPGLNHWDEMAGYLSLYCAVMAFNQLCGS
ncbi:hypothetical protein SSBR45G_47250 [Bradyrhizobium sp. SSBR45G]|uniref:hypothetical protein n=1 Tax=unclassified Bradyrhizobium TaxID=2631580 RepID=UPI002342B997|nr:MULTISPECIES: hypothetical protein [unclassified Bradyrhizobium]GLH79816.1 hypothetical protein SSBR45G_47250 [Bradyrhizobium sp. SSBR45G]GLH87066.1 hypothetical protein SSBR45R_45260 [Bradyrhizobium sp. SSBR45R]